MSISFNPSLVSVAAGTFNVTSEGLVQGTPYPDPETRFALASGWLASDETLPMWGGVGIYEAVGGAAGGPVGSQGSKVGRATALTGSKALTGFSTFSQAYGMVMTPQSPVPLAAIYGQVMFWRLGSGQRLAVAADASLVDLRGQLITTDVSWDFVNEKLIPYASTTISSGTYNSTSGLVTLTLAASQTLAPGDTVTISGATGTGSYADINGTFQAGAGTGGTTLTYTIATSLTLTISGGNVATSGILPVKVLDVQASNCMTVSYDAGTGYATWNRNGAAAIIQI